ncbi:hypothetical protein HKX48_007962 [Thoreauomyces humboldtii]|nr:hypothetical protein HKX48_007962 [Thoreauomyces humboldtii]
MIVRAATRRPARQQASVWSKNPTECAGQHYYHVAKCHPLSDVALEARIREFLTHHLVLAFDQPYADDLEDMLPQQFALVRPDVLSQQTVKLILSETWRWFRELKKARIWNEVLLREHITTILETTKFLPQEAGINHRSRQCINHVLSHLVGPERIPRDALVQRLQTALIAGAAGSEHHNWYGEAGVGKTTVLAMVLEELAVPGGHVLWFNNPDELVAFAASDAWTSVAIVCVDLVDADSAPSVVQAVAPAIGAQLVCLSQQQLPWLPAQCTPIEPLNCIEVTAFLTQRRLDADHQLHLSKASHILLYSGIPGAPATSPTGVQRLMRMPRTLRAVCHLAVPYSPPAAVTAAGTYTTADTARLVPIRPLRVRRTVTLYQYSSILDHVANFSGLKILSVHDVNAACANVEQQLRQRWRARDERSQANLKHFISLDTT